jgi:NAD(P)-dependent dehydrogenase (short-subunit alcohol dehydrogenase family)
LENRNATAAVIGAGDFIGAAVAKKFATEGFTVVAGRRNGDKLAPLVAEIEAASGRVIGRWLDARKEDEMAAFLQDADAAAPLEICIFNIGANVNFPLLETTERVFRKVWEMACYAGFLAGREAVRLMLPRGRGNIFFTGATAGMRGGVGYAAFASAKFGLRAVAQAAARELGPKGIHVTHLVIERRGRHRLGARADQGAGGRGGARQSRSGKADAAGLGRRGLLADLSGAARRLVVRTRDPTLCGKMVRLWPR